MTIPAGGAGRRLALHRSTLRDVRRDNRAILLRALYFDASPSRRELSRLTGISPATVSSVIGELLAEGVVTEAGAAVSDGGRPQILLELNHRHGFAIGVDIGETAVRVELFDLAMTQLARAEYALRRDQHEVDLVVAHILDGVRTVLAEAGVPQERVIGIGIGVPGIVEQQPEQLVHARAYGWAGVPLAAMLAERTPLRLFVDNGAKTLGQAELWFGAGRGARHAVLTLIGTGVGASVVAEGFTYRGATSSAGEWGHTTIAIDGRPCRCGGFGCLEAYIGAEAILARYREAGGRGAGGGVAQEVALAKLLTAAARGQLARRVVEETVTYLGAGLANLVNLFNPERVVLGGWAGLALGSALLPEIRAAMARYALTQPLARVSLELGQLGADAVALGAATLALEHFLHNSHTFHPNS